jgi:MFS family permease
MTILDYNHFLKSQDGHKLMYTLSLPVLAFASVGVATAASIPELLFWKFLQSIGGSPGNVLGAGVIGDIYKLEERGKAMRIFFAVCGSVANP